MKNYFKFFGVALVATSLFFAACNKDEEETNDENQNQENPQPQDPQQGDQESLTIVFDNVTYNLAQFGFRASLYAAEDNEYSFMTMLATAATDTTVTLPYFYNVIEKSGEDFDLDILEFSTRVDRFEALSEHYDEWAGEWCMYDYQGTLNDFDATNMTISAALTASMFNDYEDEILEMDEDDVTTKNLTLNMNKFKYTRYNPAK